MRLRGRPRLVLSVSLAAVLIAASAPASAQSFFERLFGGRRPQPVQQAPQNIHPIQDPFTSLFEALRGGQPRVPRGERGPSAAFCVRTCDGYSFPVRANANMSVADMCNAFCPATQTRIYSGAGIANAVASDGTPYASSQNAFVYRERVVNGCTCNGRDQFGLAQIDVTTDPTLRPGDIVATKDGFEAFSGTRNQGAQFTPIQSYSGLSKAERAKLADTKIMNNAATQHQTEAFKLPLPANDTAANAPERETTGAATAEDFRRIWSTQ